MIETKKDVIKLVRSIIEFIVILFLVFLIVRALFVFSEYKPYDKTDKSIVSGDDHGFIVLSYVGVDREGSPTLISTDSLDEQFKALSDMGYVTITQQDIIDYYNNGTPLPDKSLYLMFEDGRNDTSVFAQSIMEKYNFKASIYSYAERFLGTDSKFLTPEAMLRLEENGYWELGTNGYRLRYINVFDRYGRFIGELSADEYSEMAQYLEKDYNQYLMDFLRDENKLPVETIASMRRRVEGEYNLMSDIYEYEMEKVPRAYVLMHSNTGNFGNNDKVSAANAESMSKIFDMNFNREGSAYNSSDVSIFDLTRMQPQACWSVNHMLMRIKEDLPESDKASIKYIDGDLSAKSHWEELSGVSQFDSKSEKIVITSDTDGKGIIKYKDSKFSDGTFEATLRGNIIGEQTIYLRGNDNLSEYVAVTLKDNKVYISESNNKDNLFELDLFDFDHERKVSVDEAKRDALAGEYRVLANNADSYAQKKAYRKLQFEAQAAPAKSVAEGAEEYREPIRINEKGDRRFEITVKGDVISLKIDGRTACENVRFKGSDEGCIALGASYSEDGYQNRGVSDTIYDATFIQVTVRDKYNDVIYTNRASGIKKVLFSAELWFNRIVNWFIKNL